MMRCCDLDWYVCRTYFDLDYFEVFLIGPCDSRSRKECDLVYCGHS
jgi:hypothetical protein